MHFSALAAVALAASVSAKTISVKAGEKGFTFDPESFTADVGDLVEVSFFPLNHSIAQGDPSTPCMPTDGGFWSGYLPVADGPADQVFQFKVNSTDPIFFYCAQKIASHCASGMVGVINPPSDSSLSDFKAAAAKTTTVSNPPDVFGGVLVSAASASASASASAASGSSDNSSSSSASASNATSGTNNVGGGAGSMSGNLTGNGTSPSHMNDGSSLGSLGGVAAAVVGMAVALMI